jgi:hypothetical protein
MFSVFGLALSVCVLLYLLHGKACFLLTVEESVGIYNERVFSRFFQL